jgi:hypothetical protein
MVDVAIFIGFLPTIARIAVSAVVNPLVAAMLDEARAAKSSRIAPA